MTALSLIKTKIPVTPVPPCHWPLTSSVWWTDHEHQGSHSISFKPSPRIYLFILHSLVSAGPTYINLFFNHNSLSFLGTMMTDELQELNKHSSPKVLVWKQNKTFLIEPIQVQPFEVRNLIPNIIVTFNQLHETERYQTCQTKERGKRQHRMIFHSRLAILFDVGV